ncbi:hypothetical protein D1831_09895 [Lactiplantibacillus garii]|uniref:Uncharacterized protein n=1 Tax=Lactiplantibacillus garii TaxID=2306423 RepID=A0A426D5K5_9LACO|nr:hypothetical protein D1831_09895 [Lactiplantibacillus garii]
MSIIWILRFKAMTTSEKSAVKTTKIPRLSQFRPDTTIARWPGQDGHDAGLEGITHVQADESRCSDGLIIVK